MMIMNLQGRWRNIITKASFKHSHGGTEERMKIPNQIDHQGFGTSTSKCPLEGLSPRRGGRA
jgi:hypothetical protein